MNRPHRPEHHRVPTHPAPSFSLLAVCLLGGASAMFACTDDPFHDPSAGPQPRGAADMSAAETAVDAQSGSGPPGSQVDASAPILPGEFGDPCQSDDTCASDFCVPGPDGRRVCTRRCRNDCPSEWECRPISNAGPDTTFICVAERRVLCLPCQHDGDCGSGLDLCLTIGRGSYCGRACDPETCPEGFTCTNVNPVGDADGGAEADGADGADGGAALALPPAWQCLPDDGTCRPCQDADGDGYGFGEECAGIDCDEGDPNIYEGATEICDGVDNDCNALPDDQVELPDEVACLQAGICAGTQPLCRLGQWICDYPLGYEAEQEISCDHVDNDCDGVTDEDFDFQADVEHCGDCGNACAYIRGTGTCVEGMCRLSGCLEGNHDIDGVAVNGCEYPCRTTNDGIEQCDGIDNNCDGRIDENYNLQIDLRHCGACNHGCDYENGTAECQWGACHLLRCDAGWHNVDGNAGNGCEYGCELTRNGVEVCDGIDNDCNGGVDEGFDLLRDVSHCGACGQTCHYDNAVPMCVDGQCAMGACEPAWWDADGDLTNGCEYPCLTTRGAVEYCDAVDNDCNGIIDDGFDLESHPRNCGACGRICFAPNAVPRCTEAVCAIAQCHVGWHDVDGDVGNGCEYACQPDSDDPDVAPEDAQAQFDRCDDRDNDCDGLIDEDIDPSTDIEHCGACDFRCTPANAEALCLDGECGMGTCHAGFIDLNGELDDGCEYACVPEPSGVEVCNERDDDCNGVVDEGFDLTSDADHCGRCDHHCFFDNGSAACTNGACALLACRQGFHDLDGEHQNGCEYACTLTRGGIEACDAIDNDCDGEIDEGFNLETDIEHCGECGNACRFANGISVCQNHQCVLVGCELGHRDFDENPENGCEYGCTPTFNGIEICDGIDNDCNQQIDETFDFSSDEQNCGGCGRPCQVEKAKAICVEARCAVGECADGFHDLDGWVDNGCEYACEITLDGREACDGIDNDCDGEIDEDFDLETDVEHCGVCEIACDYPTAEPRCVDGACEMGACDAGFYDVDGDSETGCEYACQPTHGGIEACDAVDNDCDGAIDEEFDLDADVQNCGRCGFVCVARDATPACLSGECAVDTCPDGRVDLDRVFDNGCEYVCTVSEGGVERCDGLDNDCDGETDEEFDLGRDLRHCGACNAACDPDHATAACDEGICSIVACADGFRDLDGEVESGCEYSCQPTHDGHLGIERCDGIDNDCDGAVDEDFDLDLDPGHCGQCGHACTYPNGTIECVAGVCEPLGCGLGFVDADGELANGCEYECTPSHESVEICDDRDNDCDGRIDEGFDTDHDLDHCGRCNRPCNPANSAGICDEGTCRIDACAAGFIDLNRLAEDGCEYACTPTNNGVEICDDRDNDCNGFLDEGFDLSADVEHCGACGRQCRFPAAEPVCAGGECLMGRCEEGFRDLDEQDETGCEYFCTPSNGGVEACDHFDNDCDGRVDEGFAFKTDPNHCGGCRRVCAYAHAEPGCAEGLCFMGACRAGFHNIDGDAQNGCEYACTPSNGGVEVCDRFDNDCDGLIDEGFALDQDPNHCGQCNRVCQFPAAEARCVEGGCVLDRCIGGSWDLDGDAANGCEYACVFRDAHDDPDLDGIDANCDGIDGMADQAVFVSASAPDDNGLGTASDPLRTLGGGINRAGARGVGQVLVAAGYYDETVTLTAGVSIYGGYSPGLGWARSIEAFPSIIAGHEVEILFDHPAGIVAVGIAQATEVQGFTVTAQAAYDPGASSYGIYARDCTSALVFSGNQIQGGNGAAGRDGDNGPDGDGGGEGGDGDDGCGDCSGGGGAGLAGPTTCRRGGGGGGGGGYNGNGGSGSPGSGVEAGGGGPAGGGALTCLFDGADGQNGGRGGDGSRGFDGNVGNGQGDLLGSFWFGSGGHAGTIGSNGHGGGGGGGGGGGADHNALGIGCDGDRGGGGGGGGGGGCAGRGGQGGGGGGGTFGVFLVNASVTLRENAIRSANGGRGGRGGAGGVGGAGGPGGTGGTGPEEAGLGGWGGHGGRGGDGGCGGGGGGGISYAVYRAGTSNPTLNRNELDHGEGGAPGRGGCGNNGQPGEANDLGSDD